MKRKKPETEPAVTGEPRETEVDPGQVGPAFEESFGIVEGAVERLESGDLSLEDSLREYERGLESLRRCYEALKDAQRRIEVLGGSIGSVVEGSSAPEWKPGSSHAPLRETLDAVEREEDVPEEP